MISLLERTSSLSLLRADVATEELARRLNCSPLTALLLQQRGVGGDQDGSARALLHPSLGAALAALHLGEGLDGARSALADLKRGSRLVVYGDYDVDGVASTVLAVEFGLLREARVRYYIPHRHSEGYGFHPEAARRILDEGCDFLIVLDCGSRDVEAVSLVSGAGVPVVVFDHHLDEGGRARPRALVNPQIDGDGEARRLCAAAVFWSALERLGVERGWLDERLDLVALASLADCVPLGALNRALVREGLERIRGGRRPGLAALLSSLGLDRRSLSVDDLVMRVIPCLNAAGRLDVADRAVAVLLGEGRDAESLVTLNRRRQLLSGQVHQEASSSMAEASRLVLSSEAWPVGVLSGVASRLCRERDCPVVLAAPVGDLMRGTLRLPDGGNAVEILSGLSDSLETWGGHRFAAGFSVRRGLWPEVQENLEVLLRDVEREPERIEALLVEPSEFRFDLLREIDALGPFGVGNPSPLFFCPWSGTERIAPLGRDGRHVKVERAGLSLLAFDGARLFGELTAPPEGLLYGVRENVWQGRRRLQFLVERVVAR
ncbi:single-stranded DNA exonuclease RecJ [Aminithiophilus ramosus]|uniref:Single-stranded DNA exonuclease RecJ n=2 Tax=Synergistales TaxID=649776 RepID=A0A9Q7A5M0_9BACT|nr:DHH family phosphoesterase [Aminithiophilus ramosus]QTX31561.1 single-stranded DNA exonuclease RecJ [Aminithiophilus ramosus]QVL35368.1 single-stranded DNA exonuclease RecJ [Synergistota bacterium]